MFYQFWIIVDVADDFCVMHNSLRDKAVVSHVAELKAALYNSHTYLSSPIARISPSYIFLSFLSSSPVNCPTVSGSTS